MNYFAHGRRFVDAPFLLAGPAVPDWLSGLYRRSRARSKSARRFITARDQRVVQVAVGVVLHHHDDDWFHRTRAFAELNYEFTAAIRDRLRPDDSMRPSFLGHILVELLLDDCIIRQQPRLLDEYYRCLDSVDAEFVAWVVDRIATRPVPNLGQFIPRFSRERFLYDYADDAKLLFRLNNVMHRVGLPLIPETLVDWFPIARDRVSQRMGELLSAPEE